MSAAKPLTIRELDSLLAGLGPFEARLGGDHPIASGLVHDLGGFGDHPGSDSFGDAAVVGIEFA